MAGPGVSSPGGFSYAQAAKGRASTATSQAPSSKVTSGAATPATGMLSEFENTTGVDWADDMDYLPPVKQSQANEEPQEKSKPAELKSVVERAKAEEKAQNSSGVSSPDLAASATSNDETSSANNGSSQTSWEAKSNASETQQATDASGSGSWITARAERAERQSGSNKNESSGKGRKNKAEKTEEQPAPPPKPVVLTEAPAPTVNPWAKRAEENKAKQATVPQSAPTPAQAPSAAANLKENQRPRADSRKKNTATGPSTEPPSGTDAKRSNAPQGKRSDEQRLGSRQGAKPATGVQRADVNVPGFSRPAARDSRPNTAAPPPVKDEVSWPTPDTAPAPEPKERKPAPEKDSEEKNDESGSTGKGRKKQEWKPVPVVPNILWETPSMRERSARGSPGSGEGRPRGGAAVRGRGNFRGNAVNGVTPRAAGQSGENARIESNEDAAVKAQSPTDSSSPSRNSGKPASQPIKDTTAGDAKAVPQRNTKSKTDATATEGQDGTAFPEPIPRGPKADEAEHAPHNREGQATRQPPTEKPAGREGNYGSGRGAKRGGRGRGGSREFVNGHHGAHAFANANNGPEFSAPFGVPQSPSFQASRGNHTGNFSGPGRAGWRGNSRAQSFPVENTYNRFPVPFPVAIQGYGPGVFEYGGYPVSPIPYNPMMDPSYLFGMVSLQVEYYFSIDNLLKDMYLRKNMDSQGFVYLEVIASFNRIKTLTQDWELLRQVCLQSESVQIRVGEDAKERVRKSRDYEQFVLPMDDRFPSARHEGPKNLEIPEQRMPAIYGPMNLNPQGGLGQSMRLSRDNANAMMNAAARGGFYPQNPDALYGEEVRGRAQRSPAFDAGIHQSVISNGNVDVEPDVFPEHKLEQLTVCVRLSSRRVPYHTAAARTFSNGSIDQKSITGEMTKQNVQSSQTNGEVAVNGVASPAASRGTSPSAASSPERAAGPAVFWIKDTEHPVGTLPSGLTPEPYVQLRLKAFEQRGHAATGTCPYDLKVLYQFWSHFLIRNFNNRMYSEFKYYAETDAKERVSFEGQKNLVKYYGEAVQSANALPIRVAKDYIEFVKAEGPKTESAAFKSLQAAWRNGALNLRNRKKLSDNLDDGLKAQLDA